MKQAWHIFKKDCRRFWPVLLALVGVLAFFFYRAIRLPPIDQPLPFDGPIDWILDLCLILFTAQLILEDPLLGRQAFWMTRPIRRGPLLLAKLLFAALFLVLLPLLVQAAALLWLGVEPAMLPWAALSSLLATLPYLALAAALAAVCRNLPVFALAGCLAWVATQSVFGLLAAWNTDRRIPFDAAISSGLLTPLLLLIVAAVALTHQFWTRRALRSALLLGGGLLAAQMVFAWVPTNLEWKIRQLLQPRPETDFQLRLCTENTRNLPYRGPTEEGMIALSLALQPPESRPPFEVWLSSIESRFQLAGLELQDWRDGRTNFADQATFQKAKSEGRFFQGAQMLPIFELDPLVFQRWSAQTGRLESKFFFRAQHERKLAELPLLQGEGYSQGLFKVEMGQVQIDEKALSIELRGRRLILHALNSGSIHSRIVDPSDRLPSGGSSSGSSNSYRTVVVRGCQIVHFRMQRQRFFDRDQSWKAPPGWLPQARLQLWQPVVEGVFAQKIEMEPIRLADLTDEAWRKRVY